jgi:hypothetical protein
MVVGCAAPTLLATREPGTHRLPGCMKARGAAGMNGANATSLSAFAQ